ncbi:MULTISPECIES: lytic transglycosylase domain-containing protein [Psychrilyobacter]|nr:MULTISPECIES: lytic transglycosylase domain-containing protein [Psychrilyobacter]MCS5422219.1 lytic transglycosylase domain-containing protein [Psychrilyobacter sp. S5]NDI78280.1 lytic transglycosylase domain-containing protein [Psychrilyobacter piezotolerans]
MKRIYIYILIFLIFTGTIGVISFFPLKYYGEIDKISKKYEIDREVIYSVIKIESNFREHVVSHKGAVGLMQIMPSTGEWMAKSHNLPYSKKMLLDPVYNIEIGTLYLHYLMDRYDGDVKKVLVAYNAGPSRLEDGSWKKFKETKNYLIKYKIAKFFYRIRLYFK